MKTFIELDWLLIGGFGGSYGPFWVPERALRPIQAANPDLCPLGCGQSGSTKTLMNNPG